MLHANTDTRLAFEAEKSFMLLPLAYRIAVSKTRSARFKIFLGLCSRGKHKIVSSYRNVQQNGRAGLRVHTSILFCIGPASLRIRRSGCFVTDFHVGTVLVGHGIGGTGCANLSPVIAAVLSPVRIAVISCTDDNVSISDEFFFFFFF